MNTPTRVFAPTEPVRMYPLSAYRWQGIMAAQAWNRGDEALAVFEGQHARKMWALETTEYATRAKEEYLEAYFAARLGRV